MSFIEIQRRVENWHGEVFFQIEEIMFCKSEVHELRCKASLVLRTGGFIVESFGTSRCEQEAKEIAADALLCIIDGETTGLPWAKLDDPVEVLKAMMDFQNEPEPIYHFENESGSVLLSGYGFKSIILALEGNLNASKRELAASMLRMLKGFWREMKGDLATEQLTSNAAIKILEHNNVRYASFDAND